MLHSHSHSLFMLSFLCSQKSRRLLTGLVVSLITQWCCAQTTTQAVRNSLAEGSVTALLMTDDDVVNLGFVDFNPNDYVEINDRFGTDDSKNLRGDLKSIAIPWEKDILQQGDTSIKLKAKLAYLERTQEVLFANQAEEQADKLEESTLLVGFGAAQSIEFAPQWELETGFYLNWLRYRNHTDFNSNASRALASRLNGVRTNMNYQALIAEPVAALKYYQPWGRSQLQWFAKAHYLSGTAIHPDMKAHDIKPEAWYTSVGVDGKRPFARASLQGNSLWYHFAKVDMGGDLSGGLGANNYYEAGVAWLVDTPKYDSWLSNIGLGISLNYGSELKGGTLVLLFNK